MNSQADKISLCCAICAGFAICCNCAITGCAWDPGFCWMFHPDEFGMFGLTAAEKSSEGGAVGPVLLNRSLYDGGGASGSENCASLARISR